MKKIHSIVCFSILLSLISSCKKEPLTGNQNTPLQVFQFPFEIHKYKIEQDSKIGVYVKTGIHSKKEIEKFDPAILNDIVSKEIGWNVIKSIAFESKDWAEFQPKCVNNRMKISKTGSDFLFDFSYCKAKGVGNYDDLYVDCQAFSIHATDGKHYFADSFRDACFVDQAFDCQVGDTVAILNYKVFLKK